MYTLFLHCLLAVLCCFASFSTIYALDVTVGMTGSGADYEVDGVADEEEIQIAIDDVLIAGGGTVTLGAGTYSLNELVEPRNNVHLEGAGINQTILKSTYTFSYLIFNETGSIENFWLQNMTIDADNQDSASGVRFHRAKDVLVQNVKFVNVSCGGYGAVFGVNDADIIPPNAPASHAWCDDNVLDNCLFDGHSGSLEMLLVYNSRNMRIQNTTFQNKGPGCPTDGNLPVIGLWQWTENIYIYNTVFQNNNVNEAIYYSNTCTNTVIENSQFTNTGTVRGSNVSDHCTFDIPFPTNLVIRGSTFIGGANDIDKAAIIIGGVENVLIENCAIEEYVVGISYREGYSFNFSSHGICEVDNLPQYVAVVNTVIKNCNNTENLYGIHPGVLYEDGGVGNVRHFYVCGEILDEEVYPTGDMIHPFSFIGGGVMDSFFILGMHLQEDAIGQEFNLEDGTTMGTNMCNEQCDGGGSEPAYCTLCAMSDIPTMDVINLIDTKDTTAGNIVEVLYNLETIEFSLLPIELVDFSVKKENQYALLNWQSALETNADRYEIERSTDGRIFRKIGSEKAVGESNQIVEYTYIDQQPEIGENKYRLRLMDKDGVWTYSEVKSVFFGGYALEKVWLTPNPAENWLAIETNGDNEQLNYRIFDQLGHTWQHGSWWAIAAEKQRINIEKLPKGLFFIEISTKSESQVLRFYTN